MNRTLIGIGMVLLATATAVAIGLMLMPLHVGGIHCGSGVGGNELSGGMFSADPGYELCEARVDDQRSLSVLVVGTGAVAGFGLWLVGWLAEPTYRDTA